MSPSEKELQNSGLKKKSLTSAVEKATVSKSSSKPKRVFVKRSLSEQKSTTPSAKSGTSKTPLPPPQKHGFYDEDHNEPQGLDLADYVVLIVAAGLLVVAAAHAVEWLQLQ